MDLTKKQYFEVVADCRELFVKKMKDYGAAYRILLYRLVTGQICIKGHSHFSGVTYRTMFALIKINEKSK
jgi:hypothetical protein